MSDDDDELLAEFLVEGRENLDRLERELLAFEGAASAEMIAAVFRTAHTVKGTAGFFGFTKLQHLMHTAESLLSRIRDGELSLTSPMVSCLLDVTDAARDILNSLEARAGEGDADLAPLVAQLVAFGAYTPGAEPGSDVEAEPAIEAPAPAASTPAPAAAVVEQPAPEPKAPHEPRAETTVRVDTTVLDAIMDLAGELVLTRNQLLQLVANGADPAFVRVAQRLDTITSELQEGVMRTRMQPIGGAWAKLPRVVRDLAGELGKQVDLQLVGQETALDRTILEGIKDPLTHIVRNAIDHGIEAPQKRLAAGKAATGTLRLSASHSGGHVAIEISDDGNGIDPERVRRKIVERALVTADRAARMTEAELVQMIFAPGFSTAEKVTNVSGRGVGMDVVKTNVQAIGGTVHVSSTFGQGMNVRIDIPLTLAIIPALLVAADGQRYAIPEGALVEILRIDPGQSGLGVEYIHGAPVYRRHGELIPLLVLGELLAGRSHGGVQIPAYVAIVIVEGRKVGLVVDDLHDTEEIVVKPLGKHVRHLALYAGATILGDGRVALILDPRGIAQAAGLTGVRTTTAPVASAAVLAHPTSAMLVVRGDGRRLALPLADVARLEEVSASSIERAGSSEVIQYRGKLLPLVRLASGASDKVTVIVHSGVHRAFGLVVDGILDVVEVDMSGETGVRGSAVIAGYATDIVDVHALGEGIA